MSEFPSKYIHFVFLPFPFRSSNTRYPLSVSASVLSSEINFTMHYLLDLFFPTFNSCFTPSLHINDQGHGFLHSYANFSPTLTRNSPALSYPFVFAWRFLLLRHDTVCVNEGGKGWRFWVIWMWREVLLSINVGKNERQQSTDRCTMMLRCVLGVARVLWVARSQSRAIFVFLFVPFAATRSRFYQAAYQANWLWETSWRLIGIPRLKKWRKP